MRDNWLVKFASRQTPSEVQFRQQLDALPLDQLRDLVGPPSTSHLQEFQEKAASAIAEGRRLAHEAGPQLLEKSAQEAAADQAVLEIVNSLSDEDAIKLAHLIENETDAEKIAAGLMNMAGGALKSMGSFAFKHPHAAAAIGGGIAGGLATGNVRGAMAGAGLGYGASKMIPGAAGFLQHQGANAIGQGAKMMGKVAEEINELYKVAFVTGECEKSAGPAHGEQGWLSQFEGTPLLQDAIALAEQEVQMEIAEIQKRQERHARMQEEFGDDEWTKRDIIRARKHLLELQLVAQRNGLGAQDPQAQGATPPPAAAPQAAPPTQPQGVGSTQAPLGDQTQNGMPKQAGVGETFARVGQFVSKHPQATATGVGAAMGAAADKGHRARGAMIGAGAGHAGASLGSLKVASFPIRR